MLKYFVVVVDVVVDVDVDVDVDPPSTAENRLPLNDAQPDNFSLLSLLELLTVAQSFMVLPDVLVVKLTDDDDGNDGDDLDDDDDDDVVVSLVVLITMFNWAVFLSGEPISF